MPNFKLMRKNLFRFEPWIGELYFEGINGKKIMILGESHYCANENDATPDITNRVINDLFNPDSEHESYKNTYTKFIRALSGNFSRSSTNEKKEWWNKVLFYNYVQFPISSARQAPSSKEFVDSADAFFEVLNLYKPDCVLVWGTRLYKNLPRQGHQLPDLIIDSRESFETWAYETSDGHIVQLIPHTHPSSAFSPDYWHTVFMAFLNRKVI